MKKVKAKNGDEVRSEYDLKNLKLRKLGPGRKSFGDVVRLEPDVIEKHFLMLTQSTKLSVL
jgi:hypothetical protein